MFVFKCKPWETVTNGFLYNYSYFRNLQFLVIRHLQTTKSFSQTDLSHSPFWQFLSQKLQLCLASAPFKSYQTVHKQAINPNKHAVHPYLIQDQTTLGPESDRPRLCQSTVQNLQLIRLPGYCLWFACYPQVITGLPALPTRWEMVHPACPD